MPTNPLLNYLRTHRKRAGLSQEDVTVLLGAKSAAKVCRYERFARQPGLGTAFAYEVIFRVPAHTLFNGLYAQAERAVMSRAKLLIRKLAQEKPDRTTSRKLDALRAIAISTVPDTVETP